MDLSNMIAQMILPAKAACTRSFTPVLCARAVQHGRGAGLLLPRLWFPWMDLSNMFVQMIPPAKPSYTISFTPVLCVWAVQSSRGSIVNGLYMPREIRGSCEHTVFRLRVTAGHEATIYFLWFRCVFWRWRSCHRCLRPWFRGVRKYFRQVNKSVGRTRPIGCIGRIGPG